MASSIRKALPLTQSGEIATSSGQDTLQWSRPLPVGWHAAAPSVQRAQQHPPSDIKKPFVTFGLTLSYKNTPPPPVMEEEVAWYFGWYFGGTHLQETPGPKTIGTGGVGMEGFNFIKAHYKHMRNLMPPSSSTANQIQISERFSVT